MHIIHDTMQILIERNTLKHKLSQKYESSESHSKRKNGPCVSNLNSVTSLSRVVEWVVLIMMVKNKNNITFY